jgi:hypothetical protein
MESCSGDTNVLSDGCLPLTQPAKEDQNSTSEPLHHNIDNNNNVSAPSTSSSTKPQHSDNVLQHAKNNKTARIDLNSQEMQKNIPATTRKVFITSKDQKCILSKLNPLLVARSIDAICGKVTNVVHKPSGSLLVTTNTLEQVHILLAATQFSSTCIPTKTTIAWETELSQGKFYAPELQDEQLDNILSTLETSGVVSIRKLFSDPTKANIPLFVLTFLGQTCPEKVTIGYSVYKVDKYYPSPMRCGKCCRWGHSATNCRNAAVCAVCGDKNHLKPDCTSIPCCVNCKGAHNVFSKLCPVFLKEQQVCKLTADRNITFAEARAALNNNSPTPQQQLNRTSVSAPPTAAQLASRDVFPSLTQLMSIPIEPPSSPLQHIQHNKPSNQLSLNISTANFTQTEPSSQNSLITAGQHRLQPTPSNISSTPNAPNTQTFAEITLPSLPPLSPLYCHSDYNPAQPASFQQNSNQHQNMEKETNSISAASIKELIISLIPLLMQLFLANHISEKIECFCEIGSLLQLGTLITDVLTKMGLSSISNSSQN